MQSAQKAERKSRLWWTHTAGSVNVAERQPLNFLPLTTSTTMEPNTDGDSEKEQKYTKTLLSEAFPKRGIGYFVLIAISHADFMDTVRTIQRIKRPPRIGLSILVGSERLYNRRVLATGTPLFVE